MSDVAGWNTNDARHTMSFREVAHCVDLNLAGCRIHLGNPLGQFCLADTRHAGEQPDARRLTRFAEPRFDEPQFGSNLSHHFILAGDSITNGNIQIALFRFATDGRFRDAGLFRDRGDDVVHFHRVAFEPLLCFVEIDVGTHGFEQLHRPSRLALIHDERSRQSHRSIDDLFGDLQTIRFRQFRRVAFGDPRRRFRLRFIDLHPREKLQHVGIAGDQFAVSRLRHDADDFQPRSRDHRPQQFFVCAAVGPSDQVINPIETQHQSGHRRNGRKDRLQTRSTVVRSDVGTIHRQKPTVIEEVDLPRRIREALNKTTLAHTPLTRHKDMLPRLIELPGNSIESRLGYRLQPVWLTTALLAGFVTAATKVRDGKYLGQGVKWIRLFNRV